METNDFNFDYWAMLEPMKYFDRPDDSKLSEALLKKKYDMIENAGNEYIATQKWDGEWTMFIRGHNDDVLIRSRSLSSVTGKYGDKTLHLPHLAKEMLEWPEGTVVLAEVCFPTLGKVSTDVGTILRCLPDRAVERQRKDTWLVGKVFDILSWNGENLMEIGYYDRLKLVLEKFSDENKWFFHTFVYDRDFQSYADEIIRAGGEGVVIQRKDSTYTPGKRPAWQTLKLKQRMEEMELPVISAKDPTKEYQGKDIVSWKYWERIDGSLSEGQLYNSNEAGLTAVSKAYYYGWKMGVTVDFEGTMVDVSSGLTDEDREWLATEEAKRTIDSGHLYATIKAMQVASLGGLRHPVILKLRVMDDAMLDEKIEVE